MSGFVKMHPDAAVAERAFARSNALVAAGVPTPVARRGARGEELEFDLLNGCCGMTPGGDELTAFMSVLAKLHRTPVVGLTPFDPFLRIRPRAHIATPVPVAEILCEKVPNGCATVHGDLHVGQFIREPSGKVWIVDLDDLALGRVEADVANFVAHLATSQNSWHLARPIQDVKAAWTMIGQPLDAGVFVRFLRFALVRRHLKLREAGRPDFEKEIADYLRDSSNFSMR